MTKARRRAIPVFSRAATVLVVALMAVTLTVCDAWACESGSGGRTDPCTKGGAENMYLKRPSWPPEQGGWIPMWGADAGGESAPGMPEILARPNATLVCDTPISMHLDVWPAFDFTLVYDNMDDRLRSATSWPMGYKWQHSYGCYVEVSGGERHFNLAAAGTIGSCLMGPAVSKSVRDRECSKKQGGCFCRKAGQTSQSTSVAAASMTSCFAARHTS